MKSKTKSRLSKKRNDKTVEIEKEIHLVEREGINDNFTLKSQETTPLLTTTSVPIQDGTVFTFNAVNSNSYMYYNFQIRKMYWVPSPANWVDLQTVWEWVQASQLNNKFTIMLRVNGGQGVPAVSLSWAANFGLTAIWNKAMKKWTGVTLAHPTMNGYPPNVGSDELYFTSWNWDPNTKILCPISNSSDIPTSGYGLSGWQGNTTWSEITITNQPLSIWANVYENSTAVSSIPGVYFRWARNTYNGALLWEFLQSQTNQLFNLKLDKKEKKKLPLEHLYFMNKISKLYGKSNQKSEQLEKVSQYKMLQQQKSLFSLSSQKIIENQNEYAAQKETKESTVTDKDGPTNTNVEPIQWKVQDAQKLSTDPIYPYAAYEWGDEAALKKGVGVLKSQITKVYPGYNPGGKTSDLCLMDMSIFTNVIQLVLSFPKGGDCVLLSDNFAVQSGENFPDLPNTSDGKVFLSDYIRAMLKKIPPQNVGSFDMDRLLLRKIPPPSLPLPLPRINFQTSQASNSKINAWAVMPPFQYVNVGEYIENIDSRNLVAPPSLLLSVLQDERFCQAPGKLSAWPNTFNANNGFIVSNPFNQQVTDQTVTQEGQSVVETHTYQFVSMGNYFWNSTYYSITSPLSGQMQITNEIYPNVFPWAVNIQLFRYFQTGPGGTKETGLFEGINVPRNILRNTSNDQPGYMTIVNPVIHVCGTVIDVNQYPIYIPMGFKDNMDCCAGIYDFRVFYWDPTKYPPLPGGETNLTSLSTLSQIICQAQNWSYNYLPNGADCSAIGRSICNPANPEAWNNTADPTAYPSCACYNQTNFVNAALDGPPIAPEFASTATYLAANIQCLNYDCTSNPRALKNNKMPPFTSPCPNNQTCIISNVSVTTTGKNSPVEIANSCYEPTGSGEVNPTVPGGIAGTSTLYILIAAIVAMFLGVILLLLFRKRRKKKKQEKDITTSTSVSKSSKPNTGTQNKTNTTKKKRTQKKKNENNQSYLEDPDDSEEDTSEDEDYD